MKPSDAPEAAWSPPEVFDMTDEETSKADAVEDPDSPAALIGDMKRLLDEQKAEIEKLKKDRADLMRQMMESTPAAPPKDQEKADYEAFKAKVLKKAYDIVQARM